MRDLLLSEVPSDVLAEKVAAIVIEKIRGIIPIPEKKPKYITRKQVAQILECSPPTVDSYVAESLLKKYGEGKRSRYILEEVEAAKSTIYKIKYKTRRPGLIPTNDNSNNGKY